MKRPRTASTTRVVREHVRTARRIEMQLAALARTLVTEIDPLLCVIYGRVKSALPIAQAITTDLQIYRDSPGVRAPRILPMSRLKRKARS